MRGSAVTGENFRTYQPFDAGRVSDLDVALASNSLFQRAKDLGIDLRSGGNRTRPLGDDDLRDLGLFDLDEALRRQAGRPVSIMIYDSLESVQQRGSSVPIPR